MPTAPADPRSIRATPTPDHTLHTLPTEYHGAPLTNGREHSRKAGPACPSLPCRHASLPPSLSHHPPPPPARASDMRPCAPSDAAWALALALALEKVGRGHPPLPPIGPRHLPHPASSCRARRPPSLPSTSGMATGTGTGTDGHHLLRSAGRRIDPRLANQHDRCPPFGAIGTEHPPTRPSLQSLEPRPDDRPPSVLGRRYVSKIKSLSPQLLAILPPTSRHFGDVRARRPPERRSRCTTMAAARATRSPPPASISPSPTRAKPSIRYEPVRDAIAPKRRSPRGHRRGRGTMQMTQMIEPICRFSFPLDDTVAVTAPPVIIRAPPDHHRKTIAEPMSISRSDDIPPAV